MTTMVYNVALIKYEHRAVLRISMLNHLENRPQMHCHFYDKHVYADLIIVVIILGYTTWNARLQNMCVCGFCVSQFPTITSVLACFSIATMR